MVGINIALEAFALAISLLLFCFCTHDSIKSKSKSGGIFSAMLLTNILVLVLDALTWIFDGAVDHTVFLYCCNSLVYSLGYVLVTLFTWYLAVYISQRARISPHIVPVISALCAIAIILVIVSLFNNMYFRLEDGVYIRGDYYWVSQAYPVLILLADVAIILAYGKRLKAYEAFALMSYELLPIAAMLIQIFFFGPTLLYIATTLSLVIVYLTIHVEQRRRLEQQEKELTQANIAIMLSQIQSHFLYNSLCVIQDLCHDKAPEAERATVYFSEFLRENLDSLTETRPIPFERELEHTKNYLELERLRFGERLEVVYDIGYTKFNIPTLTLQPIVENAVRHGVLKRPEGGTVAISVWREPEQIRIVVTDNGVGFDVKRAVGDDKTHIGLSNVRCRLQSCCCGELTVVSRMGVGTEVSIILPEGDSHENSGA